MIFSTISDRQLAGTVAGQLFAAMSYVGLFCGTMLLLYSIFEYSNSIRIRIQCWIIGVMLVLTGIGQFVLQPIMSRLRDQGLIPGSDVAAQFGQLHGLASVLFLVTSLLGLALVLVSTQTHQKNLPIVESNPREEQ